MDISSAGHKTICVPVPSEAAYRNLICNGRMFRSFLDQHIVDYPELFPAGIANPAKVQTFSPMMSLPL